MSQQTVIFLKPDVFEDNVTGKVINDIQTDKNFKIIAMKQVQLTKKEAEEFYNVHKGKPFFDSLTNYVSRGPIMPILIEGENAIENMRAFMGNTNPQEAAKDTLRGKYGKDLDNNVLHGSDNEKSAQKEISFFFSKLEIIKSSQT